MSASQRSVSNGQQTHWKKRNLKIVRTGLSLTLGHSKIADPVLISFRFLKTAEGYGCKGTLAERKQLKEFLVRNVFERHRKYQDFWGTSTLVYGTGGQVMSLGMIQCTFTDEEHHVSPHKHPCSGKKFIPTTPSTMTKLLEEAIGHKDPLTIFDQVSQNVGGVLDCELSSELPRNSKQVKNACQRVAGKTCEDEFASLLELAKDLQWTPSPRVVVCTDQQIVEIVQECCSVNSTSILSIDTTFNVGNFYLTSTTYQSSNKA